LCIYWGGRGYIAMAQISVHLQDSMADRLIAAAKTHNYSVSKYVVPIISEKLREEDESEEEKKQILRGLCGALKEEIHIEPPEIPMEFDTPRRFDLL
jgi:hypothetical protein